MIIIIYTILIIFTIVFLLNAFGLIIKLKKQKPFDKKKVSSDNAKFIVNSSGRYIEYFVYGDINSKNVVINMHGSGLDASFEKNRYEKICNELNVKGISISLPGFGYTDMNIGRKVIDWPKSDLEPVLQAENIDKFMITGHSQGNPHALAAAYIFKDKCIGLGLYAPLMPIDISDKYLLEKALGFDLLLYTKTINSLFFGWYFAIFYFIFKVFPKLAITSYIKKVTPKLVEDDDLLNAIMNSTNRSVVRGISGSVWESSKDVCYEWGFDPTLIEQKNVSIWHASDDTLCPASIGKWFSGFLKNKGIDVDFNDEYSGYGHFSFNRGKYLEANNSLIKSLLNNLYKNKIRK